MQKNLLKFTSKGLYCEEGDFFIDPWKPVKRAVITHAHSDHARTGSQNYLAAIQSENLLRLRLGDISLQTVEYGAEINLNGVKVSLHPAGHVLGSSQVRVEFKGDVWAASGDYKTDYDLTCENFLPIKCNTFISESTFGLPIYKWCDPKIIFDDINNWWRKNKNDGKTSVIFCYALGKAQRVLSGLDTSIGPIFTHGAVENVNNAYRQTGIILPETKYVNEVENKMDFAGGIVVAPPSGDSAFWTKRFGKISRAFASGWMQIRGNRRRRSVDRGFVLSDHADWEGLIKTIKETGAENILATHGYTSPLVKWLNENGWVAKEVKTFYEGEKDDD